MRGNTHVEFHEMMFSAQHKSLVKWVEMDNVQKQIAMSHTKKRSRGLSYYTTRSATLRTIILALAPLLVPNQTLKSPCTLVEWYPTGRIRPLSRSSRLVIGTSSVRGSLDDVGTRQWPSFGGWLERRTARIQFLRLGGYAQHHCSFFHLNSKSSSLCSLPKIYIVCRGECLDFHDRP